VLRIGAMNRNLMPENFGRPDLTVAGFQLWVHGRQFPEAEDYYDGNWLRVTAHCGASGASVWAEGAILMVTEIARFGSQCAEMLSGATSAAALDPIEPGLEVSLQVSDRLGHVLAKVEITPDHLMQAHTMQFEIDQSYLPEMIRQCSAIVQEYPTRGV
jgi:hypothetical protein